jgi:hypothetical protein
MNGLNRGDGTVEGSGNLRAAGWFDRSKTAGVLWLAARLWLWLGYGWLSAAYQRLSGRDAGYLGLDGFALPMARARLHRGRPVTGRTAPPLPAEGPVS